MTSLALELGLRDLIELFLGGAPWRCRLGDAVIQLLWLHLLLGAGVLELGVEVKAEKGVVTCCPADKAWRLWLVLGHRALARL